MTWLVERVVHFAAGAFVQDGLAHFGFHARDGRFYAIDHERHVVALVGDDGGVAWTVARAPVLEAVPNIPAALDFPMYVDVLPDGALVVSCFGDGRLHRIDPEARRADVLVDGRALGLADAGNCVVDDEGFVWVNEVRGRRIRRFDAAGRLVETLGDGRPGFDAEEVPFERARFDWIYDLRRAPDGTIYVLDSRNYALRVLDLETRRVRLVAGRGEPGYDGDGGDAREAAFGGDPDAPFDGPISLALDEDGNAFVGDRHNRVVRMVERRSGAISTIAGRPDADPATPNDAAPRDPRRLRLPMISSLDYAAGRLYVPTDLAGGGGDLGVLRRAAAGDQ